jgi:hypothetical protein
MWRSWHEPRVGADKPKMRPPIAEGEHPFDSSDRQEEREELTGGTDCTGKMSRQGQVAWRSRKARVTGALRDDRITADQPRLQPGSGTR